MDTRITKSGIATRAFKLTDAPRVIELARQLAQHHGEESKLTAEFLRRAIAQGGLRIFVAEKEGARGDVVAFASVQQRASLPQAALRAHIDTLVVDVAHRKRGIGTALIDHITETFKKEGADGLTLGFRAGNEGVINFYERRGFSCAERHGEFIARLPFKRELQDLALLG